jgi:hypothetical protein
MALCTQTRLEAAIKIGEHQTRASGFPGHHVVRGLDLAGNSQDCTRTVTVPHDQGKK